jgi:hypothetical protein
MPAPRRSGDGLQAMEIRGLLLLRTSDFKNILLIIHVKNTKGQGLEKILRRVAPKSLSND